jgi:hypothetical protein
LEYKKNLIAKSNIPFLYYSEACGGRLYDYAQILILSPWVEHSQNPISKISGILFPCTSLGVSPGRLR